MLLNKIYYRSFFSVFVTFFLSYMLIVWSKLLPNEKIFYSATANFVWWKEESSSIDINYIVVDSNTYSNDSLVSLDSDKSMIKYIVSNWDNLSSIASKFWTTSKNIIEINNLKSNSLKIWQVLYVTQSQWCIVEIKNITNAMVFSNQYDIPIEDFMTINNIKIDSEVIEVWQEVLVPFDKEKCIQLWLIPEPEPIIEEQTPKNNIIVVKPNNNVVNNKTKPKTNNRSVVPQNTNTSIRQNISNWSSEVTAKRYSRLPVSNWFYAWQCTQLAAYKASWAFPFLDDKKTVQFKSFRWDAKHRCANASSRWFYTSKTPSMWSIVVLSPWRSNWYYGHVGVVIDIDRDNNKIFINEMNYIWPYIENNRRIDMKDNMRQSENNDILCFIPKQDLPDQVKKDYENSKKNYD